MKTNRVISSAVAILSAAVSFAQTPSPPASADQVFAEFRAFIAAQDRQMRDESWRTTSAAERGRITAANAERIAAMGERILADFPNDPRRWDAVGAMAGARRAFDGAEAAARKAAWEKRVAELCTLALAAPDAPPATIESVAATEVMNYAYRTTRTPDLPRALRALERLAEKAPGSIRRETLESVYLDALKKDEAAYAARVQQLARDSDQGVVTLAKNRLHALALKTTPVELKFPDLDGHEIDLANYRGKVVLLDFWATWCVPCMEEMPTIKAVYQKYHALGFEVIGITDDIVPKDPQNPRGSEKSLAQLKAFLAKENMPWPQLWDNRPKERPGVKMLLQQFDVHSLPTGMLFDKDGRLVTTDNHGEKLDANVKKLLGR
ncbi:MAG: TlpA family protein disulfide reductase [Opitutus sp.]|nr:TlpA family protein disulfide reductase [Opitutus sp.]